MTDTTTVRANVNRFEQAVAKKDYKLACSELFEILKELDNSFGQIDNIEIDVPEQISTLNTDKLVYFCTRMAVAITTMFQDPVLEITESGAMAFLSYQRWLTMIFASSPYVNADHILRTYNVNPDPSDSNNICIENTKKAFIKFCILYLAESNIIFNLDKAWDIHRESCANLCLALQSARFIGTPQAFSKRATILPWITEKLNEFPDLNKLTSNIIHDVYMHCSYDIAKNKHDIKRTLNNLIRRHILAQNWQDRQDIKNIGYRNGKPVMIVLLEHFNTTHSIYRTHSTSIKAAREYFYIIGLGNTETDTPAQEVFDEFYILSRDYIFDRLKSIKKVCEDNGASIIYMPSIGMDLHTIFASNTRLAPIQTIALGHPATTHSDYIEYVIVEDDYVGAEDCFSETLLRLPKDALPYVPSSLAPKDITYNLKENPEVVNIGIAATTMKLNPHFLEALKTIRDKARVKIHFHFALGQSIGITHPYVTKFIKSYLGHDATAYPHSPYAEYLKILGKCDMMINPFPFGNTNGIIDMITLGLVGVCKTGNEVHEHIDEALFKRLNLPDWLVAKTVEQYIDNTIRLAENHQERLSLRKQIIKNNGLKTLFSGDPRAMGQILLEKLKEWAKNNSVRLAINERD